MTALCELCSEPGVAVWRARTRLSGSQRWGIWILLCVDHDVVRLAAIGAQVEAL